MMVFTGVLAIGSIPAAFAQEGGGAIFQLLLLALLPLAVSLPLVLGASIALGLPLTAILKHMMWESSLAYIFAGALFGFVLPIVILLLTEAPSGYWTSILGAWSGAVTGRTWWVSYRDQHVSYSA